MNGRSKITNAGGGNLDAAGRLVAGHTIVINLIGLVSGATAAYCNLTAVSPLAGGYMTLWPGGTRPATSSINFTKGAIVANFAVTGITNSDTAATVSIFSSATTHVILDVTAFAVGAPGQITSGLVPTSAQAAARGQQAQAAGTLPRYATR